MKWLIAVMLLYLVLAGTVSGAQQAAMNSSGCVDCGSNSTNVTENQTVTHIFIQEASGGGFVKDGSGNYTLIMTDVVPYTVAFADRPSRDVGFGPMDKFLKAFNFGAGNPPNAAIILPEENETSDMVVVELTNPQYNNKTGTLTYKARLLQKYGFVSGWLQDHISEVDPAVPERFGRTVLVIDGCPCTTNVPNTECNGCRNSCWQGLINGCQPCGGCCTHHWYEPWGCNPK